MPSGGRQPIPSGCTFTHPHEQLLPAQLRLPDQHDAMLRVTDLAHALSKRKLQA